MFSNRKSVLSRLALSCYVLVSSNAEAGYICWIEKVVRSEAGVRVFLNERYRNAVQGIVRKVSDPKDSLSGERTAKEYFELREGDIAHLTGGAHDWCSVSAERREAGLGVQIDASSMPHGFPLSKASAFVLGAE